MNILSILLALTFMVGMLTESVLFHKKTVCRQKAWLKGTEGLTRALLTDPEPSERMWISECKTFLTRSDKTVTWKSHSFSVPVKGKL